MGSIMASETTQRRAGPVGKLRRDPFAMLPFCGYNMADYLGHWLGSEGRPTRASCPGSSTSTGSARAGRQVLWPGYGENSRVLSGYSSVRGGARPSRPPSGSSRPGGHPARGSRPPRRATWRSCSGWTTTVGARIFRLIRAHFERLSGRAHAASCSTSWSGWRSASLQRPTIGDGSPESRAYPSRGALAVNAYVLIQTEVGKAAHVAATCGHTRRDRVRRRTGPYDVIVRAEAASVDGWAG